MWDPHWTCCRRDWAEEGCTRMPHKGVYAETYEEIKREFQWPDTNAQSYFIKKYSTVYQENDCPLRLCKGMFKCRSCKDNAGG